MSLSGPLALATNVAQPAVGAAEGTSSLLQLDAASQTTAGNLFDSLLQEHLLALIPAEGGAPVFPLPEELSESMLPELMADTELPLSGNPLPPQATPIAWTALLISENPQSLPLSTPAATTQAASRVLAMQDAESALLPLVTPEVEMESAPGVVASDKLTSMLSTQAEFRLQEGLPQVRQSDLNSQNLVGAASTLLVATDDSDSTVLNARTNLASSPIPVPPRHPEWGNALGERLQWVIGRQFQQAEIRLDPPELGALEVKIVMQKDTAQISFSSPYVQVRDAVEDAIPRLREMLEQVGVSLGDVNVSQESFQQKMMQQRASDANPGIDSVMEDAEEQEDGLLPTSGIVGGGQGLLDTYA